MSEEKPRKGGCLRCVVLGLGFVLLGGLVLAGFVALEGVQYSMALLSGGFDRPEAVLEAARKVEQPVRNVCYKVMTFNVLCRICEKAGYDAWATRVPELSALIQEYDPDLLGLQELGGLADIADLLGPDSPYTGVYYRFGPLVYADCGLFYRKDRFEAVEEGRFWLSPKPHLPLSFGWKKLTFPRYVNWVRLRDLASGGELIYANTHFDNNGPNKEAAARYCGKLFHEAAAFAPLIFTGDFNTPNQTERYGFLCKPLEAGARVSGPVFFNARDVAATVSLRGEKSAVEETFITDGDLIDHIFVGAPFGAKAPLWVLDNSVYGAAMRLSDHPAVYAEICFEGVRPDPEG